MKGFAALFMLAALVSCGCSGSRYTKLDHAKPPDALPILSDDIGESRRSAIFLAHRMTVNDLGLQVGRRHISSGQLQDYFRRSGLEPFRKSAESLEKRVKASELKSQIDEGYHGIGLFEGLRGTGGGGNDGYGILVAIAAIAAIELVGVVVYQSWKIKAQAELALLHENAESYKGRIDDLAFDYNSWLALSLGVSPTAAALSTSKAALPPWPVKPALGVNAEKQDWVDDYSLERFNKKWYFGRCEVAPEAVLDAFGDSARPRGPARQTFDLRKASAIEALNSRIKTSLFPEQAASPAGAFP